MSTPTSPKPPRYISAAGTTVKVRLRVVESLGSGLFITTPTARTLRTRKGRKALTGQSAQRRYQLTTHHGLCATYSDDIESLRDFAVALASIPGWADVVDVDPSDPDTALRVWARCNLSDRDSLKPQARAVTGDAS